MDDLDSILAKITALFLDYLTTDITNAEWNRLQDRLAAIILKIQNTPKTTN
jgi:hypothetical protein